MTDAFVGKGKGPARVLSSFRHLKVGGGALINVTQRGVMVR